MPISTDLKCPRCEHTEHAELQVTVFPATYVSDGRIALEIQAEVVDQKGLETRFEQHYNDAGHTP